MNRNLENGLYYIDENFKILYINDVVKKIYPEITTGQQCYNAFACRDNMCPNCPLAGKNNQTVIYNPRRNAWLSTQAAEAELPGIGKCYSVTFCVQSEKSGSGTEGSEALDNGGVIYYAEHLEEQNRILEKQNRLMDFIIDGIPGGYHRCAVTDGYPLVYTSDKFLDMIGFTQNELYEKFDNKFVNLVHPDDLDFLGEMCGELLRKGNDQDISLHYRIMTKNGYIQVVDTTRVSEYEGVKYFQCVIIDISEGTGAAENDALRLPTKNLRNALVHEQEYRNQLNELLEGILDSVSCGVFAYTLPERKLLLVNNAAKNMINCAEYDDPIQKLHYFLTECVLERDRAYVSRARDMLQKPGDITVMAYSAKVRDEIISLHTTAKMLQKPDGENYVLITLLDTTELDNRNARLNEVLEMQKQMADSIGNGIFAYTFPEYEILMLNKEAKKMFDYPIENPNRFEEYIINSIIPEDVEPVKCVSINLRKPGDFVEYVFRSDFEDRGRVAFKCHTRLLSFENGQKFIISSITDITEQKLIEERLDEERRQYRNALAYGCETLFTVDLTDDCIDHSNHSIESEMVRKLEDILHIDISLGYEDLAEKLFSEERISSDDPDIEAIRSRESLIERYRSGTSLLDVEYRINGKNKYFRIMVILYEIDEHIHASFVVYDITSNRQEEKQRMSVINSLGHIYSSLFHYSLEDERFTVYKASPDLDGGILDGISYQEFCRLYVYDYVMPEFRDIISERMDKNNIQKLLTDKDFTATEYKRKNVGWCRANMVVAERDKNGKVLSVVFAGHPIEEQKQAELAQQEALKAAFESANLASAAKTNFLAAMSHDIRTPMNAIIGMTSIASTHINDKERVADCLSKISVSSKHLLGLINEVLDMSKIESGKMELQEEEFNLSELIDNLLTMSRPEVERKKHELTVSVRNIEHEDIIGDSQRIQQVFMNLMGNAVKYTPENGNIHLSISEKPSNNQYVGCYEFMFLDNGIGMSEEFMEHIFEPFTRAVDDKRIDKIQGTGLGMPITKNIVQMMNGDIKVESKLNEGSKFTVTMYLKLKNKINDKKSEKFFGLRVLVADSDEESGRYTCRLLSEIGVCGEWVSCGQEAVLKISEYQERSENFYAVILDSKMNDMDGIAAAKEIKNNFGDNTPDIIISAYDWSDIEFEARAAGVTSFISKPLFKSRVENLLNGLLGCESSNDSVSGEQELYADNSFKGKRVLLVEDVEINAEIAGEILTMAGFEVEYASNGKEALNIMTDIPDGHFDIILMDVQMPVMNGYDATRAIRALPRGYARYVPIIAMTANAFAEDVAEAKNAGMNEHISKPIEIEQLHKVLKKWIRL